MSTRCYIGIKNDDGSIDAIYCHHDGYPSYMGKMLNENYNGEELVRELIALGDLSSLCKKLNPTDGSGHSFEHPEKDVTVAYHRDRGEDFNYAHCANVTEFWGFMSGLSDIEHEYLYYPKDNLWVHWGK